MYAVNVTTEQQEPHLRQGKGSSGAAARAHISQTRVLSNTRCPWQIRKRKLLLERTDPAVWKAQAVRSFELLCGPAAALGHPQLRQN